MLDIKKDLELSILEIVKNNLDIDVDSINLENPPKRELGDYALGCFIFSRLLKKNPNEIAIDLSLLLENSTLIDSVSIAGPYLNIKVNKDVYHDYFIKLISYNFVNSNTNKTIIVDYIGANIGKPLHIGHMCTPNQGQAMINIYKKLGYNVVSDSHIGDWGIIFGKLILAYKKWGELSKLESNAVDYLLELYIKITEEAEKYGDSIENQIREEFKLLSEGNSESVKLWESFTKYSIKAMNIQLGRLNIKPDYNIGESFYEGIGLPKIENYPDLEFNMSSIVEELINKGIATKNEDGSVGVVFDESEKIPSCILQKRDGTHGYLASDLAAIKYRSNNWHPEKIIYFVDSRQQLHLKQAFYIAREAGWVNNTSLIHAFNGFISLKDGAMSTRKGRIIKLYSLLDEAELRARNIILDKRDDISGDELGELSRIIGIGAIKYGYLKKSRETDVIFDWDEFMSFDGNSGPYIQYAYVRAIRILEKSGINDFSKNPNGKFLYDEETDLLKLISEFNNYLINSVDLNFPHIICDYSYKLTKAFSNLYNNVHILNEEDSSLKYLRLYLIKIFSERLKESFSLLGIDMPNKM